MVGGGGYGKLEEKVYQKLFMLLNADNAEKHNCKVTRKEEIALKPLSKMLCAVLDR